MKSSAIELVLALCILKYSVLVAPSIAINRYYFMPFISGK